MSWYEENKDIVREYARNYYYKNKTRILNNKKNNRQALNEYRKQLKIRNKTYAISETIRSRIIKALKNNNTKKTNKTTELLGCTIYDLKLYLESKFTTGMTWENYGEWHIDHIKPCSSFDLTDIEQQKICFHYTNLQPLWATTEIAISYGEDISYIGNLEKGNKQ